MARNLARPSLAVSKGDEYHHQQHQQQHQQQSKNIEWSDDNLSEDDEEASDPEDCPLCLEEMDESDCRFIPCPCGYQICRFCWHKIREEGNQKCPACRRTYTDEDVKFLPEPAEPPKSAAASGRKKTGGKAGKKKETTTTTPIKGKGLGGVTSRGEDAIPTRKSLSEYRVIQRNLVYVIGISARIAHESVLKEPEYFGQYGRILKIVVNRRNLTDGVHQSVGNGGMTSSTTTGPSASAYVTFVRKEDAARAIAGVDGSVFDGRVLRATYGTTKYCSFYLRGMTCTNAGCMYLHEEGECVDSFTKDELTGGKMHLHSYVLDKAEAVGMKQFGVLHKNTSTSSSTAPVQPVQPVLSKPSTPVPVAIPAEPFTDRTPSSFFERLSKLASRHQYDHDQDQDNAQQTREPGSPPGFRSPPPVQLPPRRSFLMAGGFDPFRPAEDLLGSGSPPPPGGSIRPPPPPPIGSPISSTGRFAHLTQTHVQPQNQAAGPRRQPLFSESLSSPTAARPLEPPHWLENSENATSRRSSVVEPAVENFFNLFSHGALGTTTVGTNSNTIPTVPTFTGEQQTVASLPGHAQATPIANNNNINDKSATVEQDCWFDPKGKSIFEDPAIMQARLVNQRTVRPPIIVPAPVKQQPVAPASSSSVTGTTASAMEKFTTVKSTAPQSKKNKPSQAGKMASPPMVIQEPVFGGASQNAFSPLLQQEQQQQPVEAVKKPLPTKPTVVQVNAGASVVGGSGKKVPPASVSPSLASIDPAIISSSSTSSSAHHQHQQQKQQQHQVHYEPAKQIPSTRPPDAALLSADPTRMRDPDQLSALTAQLEAARRAKHAEAHQIEAFMREVLRKGWPAAPAPTSQNQ